MARDVATLLRQQAALATFGTFAFRETDLMAILSEAARICAVSFGVGHCKICRYRPEQDDLLIEAGYGWHAEIVGHVVSKADQSSPQGRAFATGEPVIVRNLQEANGYVPPPFYAEHGIVSTVDVLIKARGGPAFGVLEVDSSMQITYDEHDINYLTGFANVLAEAVATRRRDQLLQNTLASMQQLVQEKDRLLEQRDILAQELQHRVRNNLQLVNGMLVDQLRQADDRAWRRGLRGIVRKIMSLARVYDRLLGVGMSGAIDFGAYASLLCTDLSDLHPPSAFPIAMHCEAEKLELDIGAVTALGLVLAELISNSYEHAFLQSGGAITVCISHDGSASNGRITVHDDGSGYVAVAETKRHGIGLVRRLMQQVGGTIDVSTKSGTLWTLRFPITAVAAIVSTGVVAS